MKNSSVVRPRYTAEQFWQLLPRSILMYTLKEWKDRRTFEFIAHPHPVSGRKHPAPGEQMVSYIQNADPTYGRVDPLNIVAWMVTGSWFDVSSNRAAAEALGLDPRFAKRLHDAIYMVPGYRIAVRRKLHDACGISDDRYLKPTVA